MTDPRAVSDNPLLTTWNAPFRAPPLERIKPEHFPPAFDQALADHAAEIEAIASNPDAPTFENTVAALERNPPERQIVRAARHPAWQGGRARGNKTWRRRGAGTGALPFAVPPRR